MNSKISASVMCADLGNLAVAARELEECAVDWLHFDVMDGRFVPNFALGPLEMRALRKVTRLPFDVHLMIENPERHIERFAEAGADYLTIHLNSTRSPLRTLHAIRHLGLRAGIALGPTDPVEPLHWLLPYVDLVLVMTVEPGFAGQELVAGIDQKVEKVSEMIVAANCQSEVQVDGNINKETIPSLVARGATVLVGGSSGLFRTDVPLAQAVKEMRAAARWGLANSKMVIENRL